MGDAPPVDTEPSAVSTTFTASGLHLVLSASAHLLLSDAVSDFISNAGDGFHPAAVPVTSSVVKLSLRTSEPRSDATVAPSPRLQLPDQSMLSDQSSALTYLPLVFMST